MNVGDLVRYNKAGWGIWVGVVIKQIPGTDERQVVFWTRDNVGCTAHLKRDLEVISENR
jgi:hypothetical protein